MSQVYVLFCIQPYYNFTFDIISYISFIFSHLLSTNHNLAKLLLIS
jgi:hypothetical protein